jgi:hypothetical protein
VTAPKETCEGSGTSRKADAGASEASRRGQFFFCHLPSDDEFLRAFFGLTVANSEFRHRDHLRLAWLAVRRHGTGAAEEVVTAGIRRFAQHNSHGPLYHDKNTPLRHWSREAMFGPEARAAWQDPDLVALPF